MCTNDCDFLQDKPVKEAKWVLQDPRVPQETLVRKDPAVSRAYPASLEWAHRVSEESRASRAPQARQVRCTHGNAIILCEITYTQA